MEAVTEDGWRASQVGEELAEVGPSAAKARPASADATLEERLGEGQLSRKGQERRPASNEGGSRGGAERKGNFTRPSSSEEADEGRSFRVHLGKTRAWSAAGEEPSALLNALSAAAPTAPHLQRAWLLLLLCA